MGQAQTPGSPLSRQARPGLTLGLVTLLLVALSTAQGLSVRPHIEDMLNHPMVVVEGQNAALTCVVRNLGDSAVVWKKWENGKAGPKILTASETRVTSDDRVRVFHDEGGDVWVLAIGTTETSDSGSYVCEVNTLPVIRSFHNLTVISLGMRAPTNGTRAPDSFFGESAFSYKGMGSLMGHNYTDCCVSQNVSRDCLGFCTLKTILDGSTGEPTQCENDFPKIVSCMADGRDHLPCCTRERVPDICQDLCRGEYTLVTDNVKTHFSCPTHIERTLGCIADGVEILPSEPLNLETTALSPSSINVSWSSPAQNGDTVTEYVVNITTLRSFDAPLSGLGYGEETTLSPQGPAKVKRGTEKVKSLEIEHGEDSYVQAHMASMLSRNTSRPLTPPTSLDENAEDKVEAKMMQIKVHGDMQFVLLNNLKPFTMYEISVRAFNIHGRSLPSVKVRTLTLAPGVSRPTPAASPMLPDVKGCCEAKGVVTTTCVSKLCDPKMTLGIETQDLIICSIYAGDAFSCLANGIDHTPCCRQRGIPAPCSELCTGNFTTRLDFHYFKCIRYMSEYSGCLLEGYGVLPSAPLQLRVSNVNGDFALVHWAQPLSLPDTVTGYNVHYRPLSTYEADYKIASNVHPPYILENLYANAEYEVYVEAVNEHGGSPSSQRVVFRTASIEELGADLEGAQRAAYNETACCVKAGLSPTCLPLCSYDASMSDIRVLALSCAPEFHTLLRCAAGGRDHTQCCERRGVTESCLGVCNSRVPDSLLSVAENCLPFIGNIVQCFEEGADLLPGPVREFHANYITDTSIALSWEAPAESNVTEFEVYYQIADPTLGRDLSVQSNSLNVTDTAVEVTNLSTNSVYQFYVVSHNKHGSSVPSAMIQVNISASQFNGSRIPGVVSAPHSLVVGSHSATWVQVVWQPPLFAHPEDKIVYRVYHRSVKDSAYVSNETLVNTITLELLKPNSQYIVYVTGVTEKGESSPSETLIAWTDPAHSPFVEPPRIQPSNLLIEGRAMTVFCVALGDPTPTISLYINGKLMKTLRNRHLTQVVENITRDMEVVSCFAENGYGTPMQAARRILISHAPSVSGSDLNIATIGDTAVLECTAMAHPEPKIAFWKSGGTDPKQRIPIVDGGKYSLHLEEPTTTSPTKYMYRLRISSVTEADSGDYHCQADNPFGESTKTFNLRTRKIQDESVNVTGCCKRENVSPGCIDACAVYLDIDSVIDKPECLPEFNKLMKCAADGRDHRACCIDRGISRQCLDWCQGFPVSVGAELCAFQYTKTILNCFHENRELLPGPPQNVHYRVISENEVIMSWDPPTKNSDSATLYKLYWRRSGEKKSDKIDTQSTSAHILNLKAGVTYEAVVKAVSPNGSSNLTPRIVFTTEDNSIAYASTGVSKSPTDTDISLILEPRDDDAGSSSAGVGVGVTLLVMALVGAAIGALWVFRKRRFGPKPPGAIAFENPSYIRETNPDAMLVNGNGEVGLVVSGNGSTAVPSVSNGVGLGSTPNGWHTESLHTPRPETEVAPTLYEELRLGSDGAGFRRLK